MSLELTCISITACILSQCLQLKTCKTWNVFLDARASLALGHDCQYTLMKTLVSKMKDVVQKKENFAKKKDNSSHVIDIEMENLFKEMC